MNPNSRWDMSGNSTPDPEAAILRDLQDAKASVARAEKALTEMREAKRFPADPSATHKIFTMQVRFPGNNTKYTFMLVEANGRWFTTGTTSATKMFRSWKALVNWVRDETVGEVTLRPVYTKGSFLAQGESAPSVTLSRM